VARQWAGEHASEPENAVPAAAALNVYQPTPPLAPSPSAATRVFAGTPAPVMSMPATTVPDTTDVTVRFVPETEPVMFKRVVPTRAAGATTVDGLLRAHVHGNVLAVEQAPETTTVPAATPAPLTVVPTAKAPDVTAESVSVVDEIPPVAAADA
jgi:hypothetical protein